jgi:phosphoheptose isomerase
MNPIINISIIEHIKLAQKIKYRKYEIKCNSQNINELDQINNKLLILGNSFNALDSKDLDSELVESFKKNIKVLPAISLPKNLYSINLLRNDIGFQEIFSSYLEILVTWLEFKITIFTLDTQKNLLRALSYG